MKALTLQQPYAQLVALGVKSIETRGRATAHRGRVAIHAGGALQRGARCSTLGNAAPARASGRAPGSTPTTGGASTAVDLPLGCVVAIANLVDVVPMVDFWPTPDRRQEAQPLLYVGTRHRMTLWPRGHGIEGVDVEDQRPYGFYQAGRAAWLLEDIEPLEIPVPAKGALGLWDWTEEVPA